MATLSDLRRRIEDILGIKAKNDSQEDEKKRLELTQEEIESDDGLDDKTGKRTITMEQRIKDVLELFFIEECIERHRPWRAIYESRRCRPIPVYHSISFPKDSVRHKYVWPSESVSLIDNYLVKLGFIPIGASNGRLSLMVPRYRKYGELSFAQEWVRRINRAYSIYCSQEKKKADDIFDTMIDELCEWPIDKIVPYNGTTLFKDYIVDWAVSSECSRYIKRKLRDNGMYEMYSPEEDHIGLIVAKVD